MTTVTVRVGNAGTTSTADCGTGNHVTGGGVTGLSQSNNAGLTAMYPSVTSGGVPAPATTTNPQYWVVTSSGGTAYALCVPN